MDKNNKLDNLTVQEIKEMINNQIITIDQLDNDVLGKLMNYEVDMICFGEGDMQLIENCANLLENRNKDNYMSDERFMEIIQKSQNDHVIITEEKIENKRRFNFKRAVIIAAAVITLMASCIMIAGAFGFDISYYINKIIKDPVGSKIDVDEYTFYNAGVPTTYSSIEEMLSTENLNILYPAQLPQDVQITKVTKINNIHQNDEITFYTNDFNISMTAEFNGQYDEIISEKHEVMFINGIEFRVFTEGNVFATCYYKNVSYYINSNSYENLILIINNIKEFES